MYFKVNVNFYADFGDEVLIRLRKTLDRKIVLVKAVHFRCYVY